MKSVVDTIVEGLDIVDYIGNVTKLRKKGNAYRGKCPLHDGDNDTSLTVYPETNNFYCFSCGKSGNIINFVAENEHVDYISALELLAKEANIDINADQVYVKHKTMYEKNNDIAYRCYQKQSVVIDHLKQKRGLTQETCDAFYLGYENEKEGQAIVIPLHDKHGRIVAFARRFLNTFPKYKNSKNSELYDKSEYLFNQYRAKNMLHKHQRLYIVEGYIDCMSAYQQELACVAYCGSELSKGQIEEIKDMVKRTNAVIMYCPDNDEVGQAKIPRVWEKFNEVAPKLDVRVVRLPEGQKDFNDVLLSGSNITDLPSETIDIVAIKMLLSQCIDQHQEYNVAADNLRYIRNAMVKSDVIKYLAERWDKDISDVKALTDIKYVDDEILKEFKDVDQCFDEYCDLLSLGTSGIGFPSIDAVMKLRQTDVVFWAGYSSTYKTMVACEVALHNAIREKKNVLFFSLEMSAAALYERLIARLLKTSAKVVEEMVKSGKQATLLTQIKEKLKERIIIVDKSNLSIKDIEERIVTASSKVWKEGQTDVVILDYFQYLRANGFDEQAYAAKYTKVIAKNNNVIFFIISQLNRTGETYSKPTIKMLKGTGDLEASGDFVCLAWKPDEDPKLSVQEMLDLKGHIGVSIGKARRGANATEFDLCFDKTSSTIKDLSVGDEAA